MAASGRVAGICPGDLVTGPTIATGVLAGDRRASDRFRRPACRDLKQAVSTLTVDALTQYMTKYAPGTAATNRSRTRSDLVGGHDP
jgi:hypothetical protein